MAGSDGAHVPSVSALKEVRLQIASAAVSCIGTHVAEKHQAERQYKGLQDSLDRMLKGTENIITFSRLEVEIAHTKKRIHKELKEQEKAADYLLHVRRETSRLLTVQLAADRTSYAEAMDTLERDEPGELAKVCANFEKLANLRPVTVGDRGQVIHEGKFQQAEVIRCGPDEAGAHEGEFLVSVWTEVCVSGLAYEQGFHTTAQVAKWLGRSHIYLKNKQKQKLSPEAMEAMAHRKATLRDAASGCQREATLADLSTANFAPEWTSYRIESVRASFGLEAPTAVTAAAVGPTDPEFLILLYADAERMLPEMHELGKRVTSRLQGVAYIIGKLKGYARAISKALTKYASDFSRITDLARMTFKCQTLRQVRDVLFTLSELELWELMSVTNRLNPAYDADPFGGYRDMLLNVRHGQLRHIAEVQITLEPLLDVKTSGGHEAYRLARELNLFDADVFSFTGGLTDEVIFDSPLHYPSSVVPSPATPLLASCYPSAVLRRWPMRFVRV